jgi:hypothetical protein
MLGASRDYSSSSLLPRRGAIVAKAIFALVLLLVDVPAASASDFTAAEAKDHVGEVATVCGQVMSARYLKNSREKPTFLNLDKAYPSQIFTIVIWGEHRSKFGEPEVTLQGKTVCANGLIKTYRGLPEIVISEPTSLRTK